MSLAMFSRSVSELDGIVSFTAQAFKAQHIDSSLRHVIDLVIEELYVNMVKYNVAATSSISIEINGVADGVEVCMIDSDVERFDPTAAATVDIDAPLAERTAGGLGVYLVMKMVDSISYEYKNRSSKITFSKFLESQAGSKT
jgi:serine/threonine-protein kinase RsbW